MAEANHCLVNKFPSLTDISRKGQLRSAEMAPKLVRVLRRVRTHPITAAGWWCVYTEYAALLLPYLADSCNHENDLWIAFRTESAEQLSLCRQCAIAYSKARLSWETSGAATSVDDESSHRLLRSITDWDLRRTLSSLKLYATVSLDGADLIACRESVLASLLLLRTCMNAEYQTIIASIFQTRTPVERAEDMRSFIHQFGRYPGGLLPLCFHRTQIVRSWAQRVVSDIDSMFDYIELEYFVTKVVGAIRLSNGLATPVVSAVLRGVPEHILYDGLNTILQRADQKQCEQLCAVFEDGVLIKSLAISLTCPDERTVAAVATSIQYLLQSVESTRLFGCEVESVFSIDSLLDLVLRALRSGCQGTHERRLVLGILGPAMKKATESRDEMYVAQVYSKCFEFFRFESTQILTRGPTATTTSSLHNVRQSDLLRMGGSLLKSFYTHTIPHLPVKDTHSLGDFVSTVLRLEADKEWAWELCRNVLLTDVFNLLRCVLKVDELELVAKECKESFGLVLSDGDTEALTRVIGPSRNGRPIVTFVGSLWSQLKKNEHVDPTKSSTSKALELEVKMLLDLHSVFGMISKDRIKLLLTDELIADLDPDCSLPLSRDRRETIMDCFSLMQSAVCQRLVRLLRSGEKHPWWELIPFHSTHLLSSSEKEVATGAMDRLWLHCGLKGTTSVGSKSKLLAQIMTTDATMAPRLTNGFAGTLRVMFALARLVHLASYARFFLFCRILVDIKRSNGLHKDGSARWIVGVILGFLSSWQEFESSTNTNDFTEVCCRFLSNLGDLWKNLYPAAKFSHLPDNHKADTADKWLQKAIQELLGMHLLRDRRARAVWCTAVAKVAPSWSGVPKYRELMENIIKFHSQDRSRLDIDQCRQLAKSMDLDVSTLLALWSQDVESGKLFMQKRASELVDKPVHPKQLKGTTMLDFFPRAHSTKAPPATLVATEARTLTNPGTLRPAPSILPPLRKGVTLNVAKKLHSKKTDQPGLLNDLRRDHMQSRHETRSFTGTSISKSAPNSESGAKTKFELMREQEAKRQQAKRQEKEKEEKESSSKKIEAGGNSESKTKEGSLLRLAHEEPHVDAPQPVVERKVCDRKPSHNLPEACRVCNFRILDRVHGTLLASTAVAQQRFSEDWSSMHRGDTFDDVGAYVRYWEPLLIEEYRAAIESLLLEEKVFADHNHTMDTYSNCRTDFVADAPMETKGYSQVLRIRRDRPDDESKDMNYGDFDARRCRVHDLVVVEILPGISDPSGPSSALVGMIETVTFRKTYMHFVLRICFQSADAAPTKGRPLRVSRLSSLVTFQRQIDGLRGIGNSPDGVLWPLLDCIEGKSVNERVRRRVDDEMSLHCKGPRALVEKMSSNGILNESQASAVDEVVRSCAPLFRPRGALKSTCSDHGGISLIQGPPGTGKTSTIIGLLSTLLMARTNLTHRKVRIQLEGKPLTLSTPPIRILVCAPSNIAVDEIMSRVMNEGLWTPSGHRACPFMLRVGAGSTLQNISTLELNSVKADVETRRKTNANCAEATANRKAYLAEISELSAQIGIADKKRGECMAKLQRADEHLPEPKKSDLQDQIRSLTKELSRLHEEKSSIGDQLTEARSVAADHEATRRRENDEAICRAVNRVPLTFATLNSSGHEFLKNFAAKFDVIIVDEAGQCVEPDVLIPISIGRQSGRASFLHLTLVGDPSQLPATVLSSNRTVSKRLGRSLFERLKDHIPDTVHMLKTQYRMHPKIASFPSNQFYNGLLRNSEKVQSEGMTQPYHLDIQHRYGPLTFLDTSGSGTKESRGHGKSLQNPEEAKILLSSMLSLVRRFPEVDFLQKIAVLSPYRSQVGKTKRLIIENNLLRDLDIEVNTIDGIQGREKDIVFLSTVRGSNARDIGFVRDDRRMNVALTRAKHSIIVVGHAALLSQCSDTWASFTSHCRENSVLIDVGMNASKLFQEGSREVMIPRRSSRCPNSTTDPPSSNGTSPLRAIPPPSNAKKPGSESLKKRRFQEALSTVPEEMSEAGQCRPLSGAAGNQNVTPKQPRAAVQKRDPVHAPCLRSAPSQPVRETRQDDASAVQKREPAHIPFLRSVPTLPIRERREDGASVLGKRRGETASFESKDGEGQWHSDMDAMDGHRPAKASRKNDGRHLRQAGQYASATADEGGSRANEKRQRKEDRRRLTVEKRRSRPDARGLPEGYQEGMQRQDTSRSHGDGRSRKQQKPPLPPQSANNRVQGSSSRHQQRRSRRDQAGSSNHPKGNESGFSLLEAQKAMLKTCEAFNTRGFK